MVGDDDGHGFLRQQWRFHRVAMWGVQVPAPQKCTAQCMFTAIHNTRLFGASNAAKLLQQVFLTIGGRVQLEQGIRAKEEMTGFSPTQLGSFPRASSLATTSFLN
jgi:hypothetical protein